MSARRAGAVAAFLLTAAYGVLPAGAHGQSASPEVHRVAIGPGDTVAVTTQGAGPTVVIVPGMLGSAHGFRHVTRSLVADGHRVAVVDPLGTGASARPRHADYSLEAQAARIARAMHAIGVNSAVLVCHSVAGSMCYRLALLQPRRVHGIVAVNAGPDERAASPGLRMAMRFAPLIRLVGGARSARSRTRDGLMESSVDPSWVTDDVVEAYTRPFRDTDAAFDALEGMAGARDTMPLLPRLEDIDVPVVLLVGQEGRNGVTKDAEIDQLRAIPGFRVERVSSAGAYIQEERPEHVVAAVQALLARVAR